jgi:methylenetetrahydrofolate dehydrogenase (NADP+)/methenyltetrahydrofolate cyclohydrolase
MATIMDGKGLASQITNELKKKIAKMVEKPSLAVILVGENPSSKIYVKNKKQKCEEVGIKSSIYSLSATAKEKEIIDLIKKLNKNKEVHGILVQLPLPKSLNDKKILSTIAPEKDVDGFTYQNISKIFLNDSDCLAPCTPQGIILLLKEYVKNLEGLNVCIVGRSNIVGKPLALMLLNEDCSVDICHSKTQNLKKHCLNADIIISCAGKKHLISKNMVKKNAIIIDVGINKTDNKLYGDVDFNKVIKKASFITPVPGGVGPMTIACLLKNTLIAFHKQK